jgi:hypothetical protein
MARWSSRLAPGHRMISSIVRAQPSHQPVRRSILQRFTHGERSMNPM